MSNNNRTEVLAWIDQFKAAHAERSRPIEGEDDPRFTALLEKSPLHALQSWPEVMGEDYFRLVEAEKIPCPPIDRPAWAESHKLYLDEFPELIQVEFQGKKWATEGASAQLTQTFYIAVAEFDDGDLIRVEGAPDGTHRLPGDVWVTDAPSIEFSYLEPKYANHPGTPTVANITIDGARELEVALGDVVSSMPFDTTAAGANE